MTIRPTTSAAIGRGRKVWICGIAIAAMAVGSAPAGAAAPPPTRPGVPAIISVAGVPLGVTVTFGKPAHDGGAPVRSDEVTCTSRNGGVKGLQNGPRSPITVHGLSVGKNYTCRVIARNRIGMSNASAVSGVAVPLANPKKAVPGAPKLTYVHAGGQTLAVGFTPPADHGGAVISAYRAKCASSDGGSRGSQEHLNSPIVLDRLTPGKTYTCTVEARNTGGFGPVSNRSTPVKALFGPKIDSVVGGERSVTVAFSHPGTANPPLIVSFEATCTSSDGGTASSQSSATSPIRVRNLSIGKTYTCRLAVRNGEGVTSTTRTSAAVKTSAT